MYPIKNTIHRISNEGLRERISKVTASGNHHGFKHPDWRIDDHE